jgi:prepilin-type N-terminal cleavage/methylation domain-containing protein/prepilin-type processing-associated H-X9-DG protein
MRYSYKNFGFTLIELLVVMSIVSLLISILLPALKKARQAGMSVKCQTGIRQLHFAQSLYAQDYKGWIMPGYWGTGTLSSSSYKQYYVYYIQPYAGTSSPAWDHYSPLLKCPNHDQTIAPHLGSYKMNFNVSVKASPNEIVSLAPGSAFLPKKRFDEYPRASKTLFLFDAGTQTTHGCGHSSYMPDVTMRHNNAANFVYVDGHVAANSVWVFDPNGFWRGEN